MKRLEELDKRKVFGTIIGSIVFICCVLFFTYAWYQWNSDTTGFSVTIEDLVINFVMGPDVNVSNIGPVLNYQDGVKSDFQAVNETGVEQSFSLYLNINSITDTLLVDSFKYVLVKDVNGGTNYDYDNPVSSGTFSGFGIGGNTISIDITVASSSTYSFQFIVYIDGNVSNNTNMQENSMNAELLVTDGNLLADVEVGSYVAYTGNNGCPEGHCDGTNANYVDDTDMGYCGTSSYKFTVNGWRVMSKDNGGVYLVSAGAPECICTNSDGTTSNSECSTYVSEENFNLHINNLNGKALTYCNSYFSKDGICDETTAWAMADADFQKIGLSALNNCSTVSNPQNYCGLNNTLIDNGSYYWYATQFSSYAHAYFWNASGHYVRNYYSKNVFGVRPVLYLRSGILIVGGSGTYEDPYQLG